MESPWDAVIYNTLGLVIYVLIPFRFIVTPVFAHRWKFVSNRSLPRGMVVATLVMWPLMVGLRSCVGVPMEQPDDPFIDESGLSFVLFWTGWLTALIFQIPQIILRLILGLLFRKKQEANKAGEPDGGSATV